MDIDHESQIQSAAKVISEADALLITSGAGMGVDSGLPDFRGNQGFWNAYPPMEKLGISFVEMANPNWFSRDPELAWGFYGHRLNLYRQTPPHDGFRLLKTWAEKTTFGCFVFTSNVDGHFQSAGFSGDRILECHGSLSHLQCTTPCSDSIWSAKNLRIDVNEDLFRATSTMPECPQCGAVARPNVLMFGDWGWIPNRTSIQENQFDKWLQGLGSSNLAIIELGAGNGVPTVRWTSERTAAHLGCALIRINPREPQVPGNHISLPLGALEALSAIHGHLT